MRTFRAITRVNTPTPPGSENMTISLTAPFTTLMICGVRGGRTGPGPDPMPTALGEGPSRASFDLAVGGRGHYFDRHEDTG